MTTFTKEELIGLKNLVVENRDSAKLQKISGFSYIESINLKVKIDSILEDLRVEDYKQTIKNHYQIERNNNGEMEIFDKLNQINYVIDEDLVYSEKIVPYLIIDREDEINSLESYIIPEARSESDKELMREDLETLMQSDDEYVFSNYGTCGFITKQDPEAFNKVCLELIESYKEYIQGELKFNKNKYKSYLDTINKIIIEENLEELPNDPSLIYLQELNKEILCVDKRDTKNISLYWGKDNMYDEVVLEDLDSIIGGPDYLEMLAKESIKKFLGEKNDKN